MNGMWILLFLVLFFSLIWFVTKSKPFQMGFISYLRKESTANNPCVRGSLEYNDWLDGWETAQSFFNFN